MPGARRNAGPAPSRRDRGSPRASGSCPTRPSCPPDRKHWRCIGPRARTPSRIPETRRFRSRWTSATSSRRKRRYWGGIRRSTTGWSFCNSSLKLVITGLPDSSSGILAAVVDQKARTRADSRFGKESRALRNPGRCAEKNWTRVHPEARAQVKVNHGPEGEGPVAPRPRSCGCKAVSRSPSTIRSSSSARPSVQEVRRGQGWLRPRYFWWNRLAVGKDPARFAGKVEVHHIARGVGDRGLVDTDLHRGRDLSTATVPWVGRWCHPAPGLSAARFWTTRQNVPSTPRLRLILCILTR